MKKIFLLPLFIFIYLTASAQIAATVDFDVQRGFYDTPFSLTLSTSFTGKTIRYTTDGSAPTGSSGTIYSNPISINTTSTIRALAYSNAVDTIISTHSYIFVDDVVNQPAAASGYPNGMDFDPSILNNPAYSNQLRDALLQIPSISLVLDPSDFNLVHNSSTEEKVSVELIYPDGTIGFQENAGVKRVGGSSFNSKKRNLRLSFRSEYGNSKLEYPILGDQADDKFDQISLRPGFHGCINRNEGNDLADQVVRNFQKYMGEEEVAVHGVWMHLYINGIYWGVYNPGERGINYFGAKYYGGDKDNWDVIKRDGLALDGNEVAWNTLQSFASLDMSIPQNYIDIQEYIELEQFVDYILVCNYAPHSDWHPNGKNGFYMRDRTGTDGFRFFVWDTEPALGHRWTWTVRHTGGGPFDNLYQALRSNPDFQILIADRMQCHCFDDGVLTPTNAIDEYQAQYDIVDKAMLAEAARWSTSAQYVEFQSTRNRIVNTYFPARTNATITNYKNGNYYPSINAVTFSQNGGSVPANYQLTLTNPNAGGTLYYTTDGTDPRASGGSVASSAQTYSGSITLNGIVEVKARIKNGSVWSAMCPKIFLGHQNYSNLVINEIHYNPGVACSGVTNGDEFEFIELKNTGTQTLNLTYVKLQNAISYKFPIGTEIVAGGFLVLAHNSTEFENKYGFAPFGEYNGKLNNGGEGIDLLDPFDNLIDEVTYTDIAPWPIFPDGEGPSLELINGSLDNAIATNWQSSQNECGTPNTENSTPCAANPIALVINEINYHAPSGNDAGDWIEIYNPSTNPVNLDGWFLQDASNSYVVPSGITIPANNYLVLVQNAGLFSTIHPLISNYHGSFSFGLNNSGESISLLSPTRCLVDRVTYNDIAPWPTEPDSLGPTLSLMATNLNNELPASWEPSPENLGTPGRENSPCPEAGFSMPSQICVNVNATFVANESRNGATYHWTFQGGNPSSANGLSGTTSWNTAGTKQATLLVTYFECAETVTIPIIVENCNSAPIVVPDNFSVFEDNILTENVLDNDSDLDGDQLFVELLPVIAPSNGTLTLSADGNFTYNPAPNIHGNDSFQYKVCDDGVPVICREAIVNILVQPVNDNPLVNVDNASTLEDTPITFSLVANDNDIDGNLDLNSITLLNLPAIEEGTASVNSNGELIFIPTIDFNGNVNVFEYQICDDGTPLPSQCAVASVNITVIPVNDAPVAIPDAYSTQEDTPISGIVLTNDLDAENSILEVTTSPISNPDNGNLTLLASGEFIYTPDPNFAGNDQFAYEVCDDSTPSLCDQTNVMITINSENDPPNVVDDNASTQEDTPLTLSLMANDDDVEGPLNPNSINILNPPPTIQGTISLNGGELTFVPGTNFNGNVDVFQYEICDTGTPLPVLCETASIYIVVSSTNDAPVLQPDYFTLSEDADVSGNLLLNDFDPDGNNMSLNTIPIVSPYHGSVTFWTDGSFNYIPFSDYYGSDNFIYEVCDDGIPSLCVQKIVNLTVNPVNDQPEAANDKVIALEDIPIAFSIVNNDQDSDGDLDFGSLQLNNLPPSNQGTIINNQDGTLSFTPATNFYGIVDTIQYEICDDGDPAPALCAIANVIITVQSQNDSPSAVPDMFTTLEDQTISGNVLTNDNDLDGDNFSTNTILLSVPSFGMVLLNANGNFTYTPTLNYFGNDTFVYQVCDDGVPSLCNQATVLIVVDPVNDPPIANTDYQNTLEEVPININILNNDQDIDGNIVPSTFSLQNPPLTTEGEIIINPDFTITFVPAINFFGTVSVINYEICDDGFPSPSACSSGSININITGVNDQPLALSDTITTTEDNAISGDVSQNDSDIDGNLLTVNSIPTIPPVNGTVSLLSTGFYSYSPVAGFSGMDSFEYEICDNGLLQLCDSAVVSILVKPCPKPIILLPDQICATSTALIDAIDQGPNSIYSWSFGAGAIPQFSTNRVNSVVYLTSGIKTISLTVERDGCQRTITEELTVRQAAFSDAGPDVNLCLGEAHQLGGNPTAPAGASYSWSPAIGLSSANDSNPIALPDSITIYTVTVTLGDCVISDQVLVEVQDENSLFANAGADQQDCGEGVQLGGSPSGPIGATYSWSPAFGLDDVLKPNPICNAPSSTVYTLTVTKNGCSVADEVEVVKKFPPSLDAGQDQTICQNPAAQGVILGGPNNLPNSQYQWSPVDGLSHPASGNTYANPIITKNYMLSATNDGCISTDEVTVYVDICNEYPVTEANIDSIEINETLLANVLDNDMDPDGDNLQLSLTPISNVQNGTLTLFSNGNFEYIPDPDYVGFDNFVYQICDDGTPSLCASGVVGIWVVQPPCVDVQIGVWLEGAYDLTMDKMHTTLNTERGLLPGQLPSNPLVDPTPGGQPFNITPWLYDGVEGNRFSTENYPVETVDWVLVSFREELEKATEFFKTAALLYGDGTIHMVDTCFRNFTEVDSMFILIEHRNHLPVLSKQKVPIIDRILNCDFRIQDSYTEGGTGQKEIKPGIFGMIQGDCDQTEDNVSYDINGQDRILWTKESGSYDAYKTTDLNLDGDINGQDKIKFSENNGVFSKIPK